jgi:hypothetical protein
MWNEPRRAHLDLDESPELSNVKATEVRAAIWPNEEPGGCIPLQRVWSGAEQRKSGAAKRYTPSLRTTPARVRLL